MNSSPFSVPSYHHQICCNTYHTAISLTCTYLCLLQITNVSMLTFLTLHRIHTVGIASPCTLCCALWCRKASPQKSKCQDPLRLRTLNLQLTLQFVYSLPFCFCKTLKREKKLTSIEGLFNFSETSADPFVWS